MKVVPLESPRKAVIWEIGDCVALRSGGPVLTVRKIGASPPVDIEADWFDDAGEHHTGSFLKDMLYSEKEPEWLN